ncbi:hypothetical protein DPMN_083630 [Dreissena polymorpha]|uniref:Uncharacterized protein n=1 Tax=Dreissena polymorpha TaxID=45954 RepID=A0A9D3YCX8_DREPO|nr:hypothetical protein DPMN_083630 [Dreissena polymorpha]
MFTGIVIGYAFFGYIESVHISLSTTAAYGGTFIIQWRVTTAAQLLTNSDKQSSFTNKKTNVCKLETVT